MANELTYEPFMGFLAKEYPPVRYVLYPWLPARGLAMIAGYRGIGKTYLSLGCAMAIATGGEVLGWRAFRPEKVLYVDGEMDPAELQERIRQLQAAGIADSNGDMRLLAENMFVVTHADQEFGIPDLASEEGQGRKLLEAVLADSGARVMVIDNLSACCHSGMENESESWTVMQNWLLKLRRRGITVILVHHTGKPDQLTGLVRQRGTSKREDVLNTSILLHPTNKGGNFKLEFSKVRGFLADKPFVVKIDIDHDLGTARLHRPAMDEDIWELHAKGMGQREIGRKLGISKTTVQRRLAAGPADQESGPEEPGVVRGPSEASEFAKELED